MRTNSKEVKKKIISSILDCEYTIEELRENIKACSLTQTSNYGDCLLFVENGAFEVYTSEKILFLESLNINPNNKKFTNDESEKLYNHLFARELSNLINK